MAPHNLHSLPAPSPTMATVVGCAALDAEHLLVDMGGRTLLTERGTGAVRLTISTEGLRLMGVDTYGLVAIFSEDLSWNFQVYDLCARGWLDNNDPDFPRFVLEEDGEMVWVADVETGCRYGLVELLSLEAARRSA